ncbi:MAG: ribosome-associated translation inhibitor RaiA [Crocinitomicaceae bacterium]|nr:ribosome-associated translation inhibitor RaiA [Crocinitomicaceae bacterium]MDG1776499.1 ribosome-associated translation inhibitor RaiA [Crocinitomicaceae bacterium]
MDLKINAVNFTADAKLIEFIREKVGKLELMYDQIISSEIYLRVDKSDTNENKTTEIKVMIPGSELFAKKQCKSFEEATDAAVQALKKQVSKSKEKAA